MGLIRKSLMISTAGVVRGSSKKQRVAKSQLKELRAQTDLMRRDTAAAEAESRRAAAGGVVPLPDERQQQVVALWQMYKAGVLTGQQYEAAYADIMGEAPQARSS